MSNNNRKDSLVKWLYLFVAFILPPAVTILATVAQREWMPGRFDPATAETIPVIAALILGCVFIRAAIAEEGWPMTIGAWALYLLLVVPITFLVGLAFVGWRYNLFL